MRRGKEPRKMKDLIREFVREGGLSNKSGVSKVQAVWPEITGEELAGHTRVAVLRKHILSVAVDSAPYYYELVAERGEEIRKALNKRLSSITIQKINFHLNKV